MRNSIAIGFATPRLAICQRCGGNGHPSHNPYVNCGACEGVGGHQVDDWQLATLTHNLYAASCLVRAFYDGVRYEFANDHHAPWIDGDWIPGCGRGHRDIDDGECPCEEAAP